MLEKSYEHLKLKATQTEELNKDLQKENHQLKLELEKQKSSKKSLLKEVSLLKDSQHSFTLKL